MWFLFKHVITQCVKSCFVVEHGEGWQYWKATHSCWLKKSTSQRLVRFPNSHKRVGKPDQLNTDLWKVSDYIFHCNSQMSTWNQMEITLTWKSLGLKKRSRCCRCSRGTKASEEKYLFLLYFRLIMIQLLTTVAQSNPILWALASSVKCYLCEWTPDELISGQDGWEGNIAEVWTYLLGGWDRKTWEEDIIYSLD